MPPGNGAPPARVLRPPCRSAGATCPALPSAMADQAGVVELLPQSLALVVWALAKLQSPQPELYHQLADQRVAAGDRPSTPPPLGRCVVGVEGETVCGHKPSDAGCRTRYYGIMPAANSPLRPFWQKNSKNNKNLVKEFGLAVNQAKNVAFF